MRRQALALDSRDVLGQRADLKWGVEGSLGYITEGALLVSGRFGRFSTPWWSLYPERSEYYAPPSSKYGGDLYLMYDLGHHQLDEPELSGPLPVLGDQARHRIPRHLQRQPVPQHRVLKADAARGWPLCAGGRPV